MTRRDMPVDFGLCDEIDFPLDWEVFSRGARAKPAPVRPRARPEASR